MNFINYIIGPQLIGIIFYMAGIIMQRFPPKKINSLYGYRTISSMKNQQTWDEANRFSARWMVGCGMLVFIFGVVLTMVVYIYIEPAKTRSLILAASLLLSAIVPAILVLIITEKHLKETFNN